MKNLKNKCKSAITVILISAVLVNGCSSAAKKPSLTEEEVRGFSNGFMETLKTGDEETFKKLTTEEYRNKDNYDAFFDDETIRAGLFDNSGVDYNTLSPEAQGKVDECIQRMIHAYLSDYEITDVTIEGNVGICTISINTKDYNDALSGTVIDAKREAAQAQYLEDNYARLQNNYNTLGEEATLQIILNEFIPIFFDIVADEIENGYLGTTTNHTIKIRVEKIDGTCCITGGSYV